MMFSCFSNKRVFNSISCFFLSCLIYLHVMSKYTIFRNSLLYYYCILYYYTRQNFIRDASAATYTLLYFLINLSGVCLNLGLLLGVVWGFGAFRCIFFIIGSVLMEQVAAKCYLGIAIEEVIK